MRRKLIQNKKFDVETNEMNREVIDAMEEVNEYTKESEDLAEKMNEHIITAQEAKIHQNEMNEHMKRMVEDSEGEEEVDVSYG